MARRLISLFFLLILTGGALAGTPLNANGTPKETCPMKCCKRTSANSNPQKADAAKLCFTVNCSTSAPTSTSPAQQMNFAPLLFVLKNLPIFQFLFAPQPKEKTVSLFTERTLLKTFQPKYIQNLSLLI